jgi:hypothetical protein
MEPAGGPVAPRLSANPAPSGSYGATGPIATPRGLRTDEPAELDDRPRPRRRTWLRVAAVLIGAVVIGAVAAFWVKGRISLSSLPQLVAGNATSDQTPVVRAPKDAAKEAATAPVQENPKPAIPQPAAGASAAAPFASIGGSGPEIDAALQASTLWQILKRDFPDWYASRLEEVRRLRGEQKDDKAVAAALTDAIVKLRRENAGAALAASHGRLRVVAETFVINLDRLAKHSTEACYGFISSGEADPVVVDLLRSPDLTKPLQAQLTAVFEAIAEGRKSPQTHPKAQRADFDTLAAQLGRRGWSAQDLQLFSDERALSRAAPERVCKMVQEWFAAQLSVPDEATQIRLLVETLRPVVAG